MSTTEQTAPQGEWELAAEACGRALDRMTVDGAELLGGTVVPPNAPDDFETVLLPIKSNPLPFSDLAAIRLQRIFEAGIAIYAVATDESVLRKVVAVLEMLATPDAFGTSVS